MKILVTGCCGYIASQLIRDLPKAFPRAKITISDIRFDPKVLGNLKKGVYTFVKCDLTKNEEVWNLVRQEAEWDYLFHLGALVEAENSPSRAEEVWATNFEGTKRLLSLGKFKKIIFPSTANVYGHNKKEGLSEEDMIQPVFPYACAKKACEDYIISSSKPAVILRLSTNFGVSPAMRNNLVINYFMERIICGEDLTVHGDGKNWRPFIHVKDTCRMMIAAAKYGKIGYIYNIGAFNAQIGHLAEDIATFSDRSPIKNVKYLKDINVPFSYNIDFSKSRRLRTQPSITLAAGINELLKYYKGFI